jgi:hypothetical protein
MQEARRYHVVLQVLAPGQSPAGVVGLADTTLDGGRPSHVSLSLTPLISLLLSRVCGMSASLMFMMIQIARTETSALSNSPEFLNRVFVMRLPEPLAVQAAPGFKLQCNLFASPAMQGPPGRTCREAA